MSAVSVLCIRDAGPNPGKSSLTAITVVPSGAIRVRTVSIPGLVRAVCILMSLVETIVKLNQSSSPAKLIVPDFVTPLEVIGGNGSAVSALSPKSSTDST